MWTHEIQVRNEQERARKQDEKDRMVLKRAKALRVKRQQAQERQEAARQFRARMLAAYERRLAKSHAWARVRANRQRKRDEAFAADLSTESATFITEDNMDQRITEALFSEVATTGLVTPQSRLWKHQVLTFPWGADRSPHEESELVAADSPVDVRKQRRAEAVSGVRLMLKDMLEEIVDSGEQRENLEKYIEEMERVIPASDDDMVKQLGGYPEGDTRRKYSRDRGGKAGEDN